MRCCIDGAISSPTVSTVRTSSAQASYCEGRGNSSNSSWKMPLNWKPKRTWAPSIRSRLSSNAIFSLRSRLTLREQHQYDVGSALGQRPPSQIRPVPGTHIYSSLQQELYRPPHQKFLIQSLLPVVLQISPRRDDVFITGRLKGRCGQLRW